jgi:ParB family protein of integrating conjugative element (PFGI_1 class)
MTSATKTPESLSATARAAQLGQGAGQKVTADDVRARFALAVPKPGNAAAGLKPGDDMDGSTVILPVRSVHFYERNPRVTTNAKYTEIKESVRVQGITGDLSVTKRPGQDFYVLCAGGNTRLQIVQELLEETGDKRWETLTFRYRAWRGEAWMLAAHLAENHLRSDNTWWEQARGLTMLKEELEQELGRPLPAPELHREAKKLGMDFGVTTVRNLLFTFEQLQPIGPWLTAKVVKDALQPAMTGLAGLADTVIADHKQHQAVVTQLQDCLRTQAQFQLARAEETDDGQPPPLDVPEVIAALNDSVAGLLGVAAARIPFLLTARSNNPRLTAEELRRLADAPQGPTAGFRAPVVPSEPAEQTQAQQIPLAPMLGAVPPATGITPLPNDAPRPQHVVPAAARAPATGSGDDSDTDASPSGDPLGPPYAGPGSPLAGVNVFANTDIGRGTPFGHLMGEVVTYAAFIAAEANLSDVMCVTPSMPLCFLVDLPDAGIETIDGQPAVNLPLRRAAWQLLSALSAQWQPASARALGGTGTRWPEVMASGQVYGQVSLLCMMQADTLAGPMMSADDVARLLLHPVIGPVVGRLLRAIARLREQFPQRMVSIDKHLFGSAEGGEA